MRKKLIATIVLLFSFFGFLFFGNQAKTTSSTQKDYHRIVILSDAHYPSKLSAAEDSVGRQTKINNKLKIWK